MLLIFLKTYSFSLDLLVLEGWKSSGRPVGKKSTNFRRKRSGGFRAMTKNPDKKILKKIGVSLPEVFVNLLHTVDGRFS